jgi:hypothetical protein
MILLRKEPTDERIATQQSSISDEKAGNQKIIFIAVYFPNFSI